MHNGCVRKLYFESRRNLNGMDTSVTINVMSNDYDSMHIDCKLESTNVWMDDDCVVWKQCLNARNRCVQNLCIYSGRNLKCKRMQEICRCNECELGSTL